MSNDVGVTVPFDVGELRLPLTYGECRARFRRAAATAGVVVEAHPVEATGPEGEHLSIDVVALGAPRPERAVAAILDWAA